MGYSRALLSPRDYYIPIFLLHHSSAVLSIPYSNLLLVHPKSLSSPKVWYLLYWMYGDPFWLRRFELRLLIFQCRALTLGLQAVLEWWIFALLFLMEPSYSVYSFVQGLEAVSVLLPLDTLTHTNESELHLRILSLSFLMTIWVIPGEVEHAWEKSLAWDLKDVLQSGAQGIPWKL